MHRFQISIVLIQYLYVEQIHVHLSFDRINVNTDKRVHKILWYKISFLPSKQKNLSICEIFIAIWFIKVILPEILYQKRHVFFQFTFFIWENFVSNRYAVKIGIWSVFVHFYVIFIRNVQIYVYFLCIWKVMLLSCKILWNVMRSKVPSHICRKKNYWNYYHHNPKT